MRNLYKYLKEQTVVNTHSGNFHADDVFAAALIKKINPDIKIVRTLDITKDEFYFDIGLGEYDHHQSDAVWRKDKSTKYCSFGLLWRDTGRKLVGYKKWKKIDESLVKLIDISDNSPVSNIISTTVARFNPDWDKNNTNRERNRCFEKAVYFATLVLDYYITEDKSILLKIMSIVSERQAVSTLANQRALLTIISEGIIDDRVLILNKYIPFKEYCEDNPKISYVVYPSLRGRWAVETPSRYDSKLNKFINICPLPEDITEFTGFRFRHATGFLATFDTRSQAIGAAKYGISNKKA